MKTELKWTAIIGVAGFLWICLEYLMGFHTTKIEMHPVVTMLWIPLAIFLMVMALRDKKRALGGRMTYMQGLIFGIFCAIGIAILSALFQYIYHAFINPDFFETMKAFTIERATASGLDETLVRESAEATFNTSAYVLQSSLAGAIGAVLTTAVAMIFMRSKD